MLESMGWTDGKGLGADESGATTHIRVKKRGAKIGKLSYVLDWIQKPLNLWIVYTLIDWII